MLRVGGEPCINRESELGDKEGCNLVLKMQEVEARCSKHTKEHVWVYIALPR
jgi:hypothetical protein